MQRPIAVDPAFLGLVVFAGVLTLAGSRRLARKRREGSKGSSCSIIVKLGGSAITVKNQFETLNPDCLAATAGALARSKLATRTVVLHGAGSFGHFQAREHGVSKGVVDPRFSWFGFAETRSSVTRLNAHVLRALIAQGLPACAAPPFPTWRCRAKAVAKDGLDNVRWPPAEI